MSKYEHEKRYAYFELIFNLSVSAKATSVGTVVLTHDNNISLFPIWRVFLST